MKRHAMRRFGGVMGGLFLLLTTNSAQALLIDNFNDVQSLSRSSVGSTSSTVTAPGAIGGKRDGRVHVTSSPAGNSLDLNIDVGQPTLSHSQGSQVTGASIIEWDGGNGAGSIDHTGLGGVDLTDGGVSDRLRVMVLQDDLPASLSFTIYDTLGGSASGVLALPGFIFAGPTPFDLLFSSFVGAVDMTSVGAIKMVISGLPNTDLTIDFVETTHTPEPSTLLLLGTGILSVAGYGWRRKKATVTA
jgi:hypothetical protein